MKLYYNIWTTYDNHISKQVAHYFTNKTECNEQFKTLNPCVHDYARQGEGNYKINDIARLMMNKHNILHFTLSDKQQAKANEYISNELILLF